MKPGKTLIIAEKPSVANDIARALGGFSKHDDYFESADHILSSAVGHLLELCVPEEFEVKRGKWTFTHLPMIPPHFGLRPIEKTESRLKLLAKLVKRKDVADVINACDAGREGELIFHYLMRHLKSQKPVRRLWLQSMTPGAIRDGFEGLRAGETMAPLAAAAVCRSEADWLVGINGTRAMTAFNSKAGGFHLTTVGRVQTPTLAIVVEREEAIKRFAARDYWEVHATFEAAAGSYNGRWFDERFAKTTGEAELRAERLWDGARARAIRERCFGQPGIVTEESKPSTESCPLLYDLTSLQRDANGRFGFSARTTLSLAQALYERHKALTYPRTDSRALPEDYAATVKETLSVLAGTVYKPHASLILKQGWVRPNPRIFNNAKISDHFAIIPTPLPPRNLNDAEAKLYDLVTKRFLAIFHPAAEFLLTTRITRVADEPFKTEGKVMVDAGWQAVYGKEVQSTEASLTPVRANETVATREVEVVAHRTKPPARYTEATLLSAMEGAGKLIEDEDLREAMLGKGLGTPATRATIIENLILEKYMLRNGRELEATAKAFSLITLLRGLDVRELCSPELTGNWEFKLKRVERGEIGREVFMDDIIDMTERIVRQAKNHDSDTVPGDFGTLQARCPRCGGVVKETYKTFQCENCDFSLWKILARRQFEVAEMEQLIRERQVGPLAGFRSKMGRPFTASVLLSPELEIKFDFALEDNAATEAPDFSEQKPLGKCPKCGAGVYELSSKYVCKNATGPDKSCDFSTGRTILQRPIEREQVEKLLTLGKTDLLTRFVSKKGRPFSAFLVVGEGGKISFEFAPRVGKGGNKAKGGKKAAESLKAPSHDHPAPVIEKPPKPRRRTATGRG
ncbi:MAG: DNA topoisomerase III [Burkholderiales bacterium]|nr:DNA topoisomerase III [Burkholderiales bacterium]